MEGFVNIYELIDPRTGLPRYVGQTKNTLNERLKCHVSNAKNNTVKTHTCDWIKSLLKENLRPVAVLIDQVSQSNWAFWERHYISLYKSWGFDLTNLTDGGEGLGNMSQKIKDKISLSKKGKKLTKDHKNKIALAGLGRVCLQKTRDKRSMSIKLAYKEGRKIIQIRRSYSKSIIVRDLEGNELDKFDQMVYLTRSEKYKSLDLNRHSIYKSCNDGIVYKGLKFDYGK